MPVMRRLLRVLLVGLLVLMGVSIAVVVLSRPVAAPGSASANAPVSNAPAPTSSVPAPSGPAGSFGAGQWSSPDEVAPGLYRSAGPTSGPVPLCYVDTTPTSGGSIVDQQVSSDGPVRIRVRAGQTVKAQGCQDFARVGD